MKNLTELKNKFLEDCPDILRESFEDEIPSKIFTWFAENFSQSSNGAARLGYNIENLTDYIK